MHAAEDWRVRAANHRAKPMEGYLNLGQALHTGRDHRLFLSEEIHYIPMDTSGVHSARQGWEVCQIQLVTDRDMA